jgi:uncharacterized membrane protein
MKKLIGYFLQGLIFTVPAAATFYVLYSLFQFIDNLIPFEFPGLGFLLVIVLVTLLGVLGNTIIAEPVRYWIKQLLDRAPLVKTIYTSISDLINGLIGKDKKSFTEPLMVQINEHIEKPGFVTQDDLTALGFDDKKIAVYVPHSYAWSGNLLVVRADKVRHLNITSTNMMKFIISGGLAMPEDEKAND